MNVLVSGSGGLVGASLSSALLQAGHRMVRLVRRSPRAGHDEVQWNPAAGELHESALHDIDAVIHLAGENVGSGRWTAAKKQKIRASRVAGTTLIAQAIARSSSPPRVFLSASAVGYYGDRGDDTLTEVSPPGPGFLPDVCVEWERSADAAEKDRVRVCRMRIGVVLSPAGGALSRMLLPFKLGLGGPIGTGRQYMSWISIDDLAAAILFVLSSDQLSGSVNLVSPNPVTNRAFSKALGRVLCRPAILPMPAFAARLAFGEMADALLLASARVIPSKLTGAGFRFRHPELDAALAGLLRS